MSITPSPKAYPHHLILTLIHRVAALTTVFQVFSGNTSNELTAGQFFDIGKAMYGEDNWTQEKSDKEMDALGTNSSIGLHGFLESYKQMSNGIVVEAPPVSPKSPKNKMPKSPKYEVAGKRTFFVSDEDFEAGIKKCGDALQVCLSLRLGLGLGLGLGLRSGAMPCRYASQC